MSRPRVAKRITRRAYTILAALLLADGEWVTCGELAAGLFDRRTVASSIRRSVWDLRRFGVPQVMPRAPIGVRLAALPPDEHLESMLACVPTVKRSAWWARRFEREEWRVAS